MYGQVILVSVDCFNKANQRGLTISLRGCDLSEGDPPNWKQILEDVNGASTESILLVSDDLRILWANKVALKQTGYAPDDVVGRKCYEVTHYVERLCDSPLHPCPVPELRRSVKPVTEIHVHSDRKGDALPVEIRAYPIKDERGVLVRIVYASRDVTESGRAEEAFGATREALESRVEHQLKRQNVYGLTFRELTILSLVAAGKSDRQIATILDISPLTSQKHVSNVLHKMKGHVSH